MHHRETKKKESKKEPEEGWSYNYGDKVMCLMQRYAQQARSLTPTMELREMQPSREKYLQIVFICDTWSCLNKISKAKKN